MDLFSVALIYLQEVSYVALTLRLVGGHLQKQDDVADRALGATSIPQLKGVLSEEIMASIVSAEQAAMPSLVIVEPKHLRGLFAPTLDHLQYWPSRAAQRPHVTYQCSQC